jgi:two-component system, chemotaxis family, CheB/CheR fusion protein
LGIIVLDRRLEVQSWNRKTEDLWGLQFAEAAGKSIITLDIGLPVRQLIEVIQTCLRGEVAVQKVIVAAVNRRGRTIQCRVTCSPLIMPSSGEVSGVILLMEEQEEHNEI